NQATTQYWGMRETILGCAEAGVGWIGAWRHKIEEIGLAETASLLRSHDVRVSSLCRGGFFPAPTLAERQQRLDHNRRAIGAPRHVGRNVLVLVCGPGLAKAIQAARRMVEDGIAALLPYTQERRVRLAIEPLHPMFAGDRSVVVTLRQANDMIERLHSE